MQPQSLASHFPSMKPTTTSTLIPDTDATKNLRETQDRMDRQLSELRTAIAAMEALGRVVDGRLQELKLTAEAIQNAFVELRQRTRQHMSAPQRRLAFSL